MLDLLKATDSADHICVGTSFLEEESINPTHYNKGVSPYEVGRTMYGTEGLLQYVTVNSIKYIQRYPHKHKGNPDRQLADLIKARQSIETAIELHKEIYDSSTHRHG